jgi:hypothetical protein
VRDPPRLLGGALDRHGAASVARTQLEALEHRACDSKCKPEWHEGNEK